MVRSARNVFAIGIPAVMFAGGGLLALAVIQAFSPPGRNDLAAAPAELVEVQQIPGDARDVVRSALEDPFNRELPDPLIEFADLRPGGPPRTGSPRSTRPGSNGHARSAGSKIVNPSSPSRSATTPGPIPSK